MGRHRTMNLENLSFIHSLDKAEAQYEENVMHSLFVLASCPIISSQVLYSLFVTSFLNGPAPTSQSVSLFPLCPGSLADQLFPPHSQFVFLPSIWCFWFPTAVSSKSTPYHIYSWRKNGFRVDQTPPFIQVPALGCGLLLAAQWWVSKKDQ